MAYPYEYPYVDPNRHNDDWALNRIKEALKEWAAIQIDFHTLEESVESLRAYVNHYFEHLDVQSEVDAYFNQLIESGEIVELIRNAIKSDIVNTSFWRPFAQVLPTNERVFNSGKAAQGFAIGVIEGRPVCCNCFTDNTPTGDTNIIKFTYLDTGVTIASYTLPSGHCNSATFNGENFVIACGGGNSTVKDVIVVTPSGSVVQRHSFAFTPWAITYQDGRYYIMTGGNQLLVCNEFFDVLETHPVSFNNTYTYQGMFSDNLYLYLPCGNTRTLVGEYNRNMIEVRYHDGTLYTTIEAYYPQEIEECAIYNDVCYLASNTQDCAMIVVTDLYTKNASGYYGYWSVSHSNSITNNMYIDEMYAGFFMDGKEATPYSSLLWASFLVPPNTTFLNVRLLSDCESHPFTMRGANDFITHLFGNGHKVQRVNYNSVNTLIVTDTHVVGEDGKTTFISVAARTILNAVTIGENNITPLRALEIHGAYELLNITFKGAIASGGYLFYLMGDGYFKEIHLDNVTPEAILLAGVCTVDASFPLNALNTCNTQRVTYRLNFTMLEDLDLATLRMPCTLNITPNTINISNAPTGYDNSNIIAVTCDNINDRKSIVTVYRSDGEHAVLINNA